MRFTDGVYSSVHLTSYAEEATTKQEALIAPESFSSSLFLAVEKFRPKESYLPPSSLPTLFPTTANPDEG